MKIGLLLQRATDLKWAGPLAQECRRRKHALTLVYFVEEQAEHKAYLQVRPADLAALDGKGVKQHALQKSELVEVAALNLDVLVMQEGFHSLNTELDALHTLRNSGLKLITLAHFFETNKRPLEALDHFDCNVYISEYARQLHVELQAPGGQREAARQRYATVTAVAGSPMFDQIPTIDRAKVRAELGIKPEQRVLLLMVPVIAPTTPWRHHVWRDSSKLSRLRDALRAGRCGFLTEILSGNTFREVFVALQAFCRRNETLLMVKSRGKQADAAFMAAGADHYFDGLADSYYPEFSSYRLMAAADVCVTVNSMAAPEAVAMGRPCVNIYVPHDDRAAASTPAKDAYNRALLDGRPDSLMNTPGAVRKLDRREAVAAFRQSSWEGMAFAPTAGAEYAAKYLGIEGTPSSQRVLDVIEAVAA